MKNKKNTKLAKLVFNFFVFLIFISALWLAHGFDFIQMPRSESGSLALYASQCNHNLEEVTVAGIHKAEKSILLIIYGLTDPYIIQALREKASQGVSIKVICDAKASPHIAKKLGAGIHVVRRYAPGLMHQKILVVDERDVWLGSANMTGESLRMHANLIAMVQSPDLAAAVLEKSKGMHEYDVATAVPVHRCLVENQNVELWFLPDQGRMAVKKLVDLINTANKSVRVAMFTWTRYDLAKSIILAKKRGLDVQVVIDQNSGRGSGKKVIELLKKGGVWVALSQGDELLHHKFMILDDQVLVHGSANWTKAAFTKNDDCFMILHNLKPHQVNSLNQMWNAIIANAKQE